MKPQNKKKSKKSSIPTTSLGRAGKLFGAGLALIGKEVAVRTLDAVTKLADDDRLQKRLSQASDLVNTLSQMKGAAMKTGQLLSLEFSDLLPPEVTEVLRKLHDDSTFLPFDQIQKILIRELGTELFEQIKDLSEEPVSAASIGQVHSAFIRGEKVAIKIQFPGVDKTIAADLALVKQMLRSVLWLQSKSVPLEGFFEECERVLRQEVDYSKEAHFILKFAELVGPSTAYDVPKVYEDFSSKRVLVLSFMEGQRLRDWLKDPGTEASRQHFAGLVLDLLFKEFFEWGLVQTDPNFGNFLFRREDGRLILLDFGACNSYSKKFRGEILSLLRTAMARDDEALLRLAADLSILDPRESDVTKAGFCNMMQLIVSIFREESQPFNFADSDYLNRIRTTTLSFAASVKYTAPAKDLIFLNRKLGGMFHLLKDLGIQRDINESWQKIDALGF